MARRWNRRDVKRFDRLISMTDSRGSAGQMDRIKGRLEFREWSKGFTKDELNEMWKLIKNKES